MLESPYDLWTDQKQGDAPKKTDKVTVTILWDARSLIYMDFLQKTKLVFQQDNARVAMFKNLW